MSFQSGLDHIVALFGACACVSECAPLLKISAPKVFYCFIYDTGTPAILNYLSECGFRLQAHDA